MSKIWVASVNYGCEGHTAPIAAFSDQKIAEIFKAGSEVSSGHSVVITELEVDEVKKH